MIHILTFSASDILPSSSQYSYSGRKGSSASMSQLEDGVTPYPGLFGAASSSHQSLAKADSGWSEPGSMVSSFEGGGTPSASEGGVQMEMKYGSSHTYRKNVSSGAVGGTARRHMPPTTRVGIIMSVYMEKYVGFITRPVFFCFVYLGDKLDH